MPEFVDQIGRKIFLHNIPQRIISIVPSQTELLFSLGVEKEIIGITRFCIHPDKWFRSKKRIGGTKQLHIEEILQLQPDLILANKEENNKDQVEQLANHVPVWTSDVHHLDSALEMILRIGHLVGKVDDSNRIVNEIRNGFESLPINQPPKKACYLIWKNPYLSVGGDTFIHSMMNAAGFSNILSDRTRYPEISLQEIRSLGCEYVLLSSEPYPFKPSHAEAIQAEFPEAKILLVDGEMFSWYGSRLLLSPAYFRDHFLNS